MPILGSNAVMIGASLLFTGALVAGVQYLPPLTQPDASTFPEFQQYRPVDGTPGLIEARDSGGRSVIVNPGAYCQAELSGVDCGCFRETANQVLRSRKPRVSGWRYADDWELALAQAKASCD
ncbi:hypothetical protein [Sagittula salina]|uniref:Uncharacterized protein n=1 Tax=Sagittula salina TaxID=2820268 RepID=A0A940S268_9RHOB|nr:hypothetical protein [Sagittula salina]MBP0481699.1 hypothetical protein [Sagittula salina]